MDVTTTRRDFKCDQCKKFGIIEYNEQTHVPITDGTWFEVRTQGCGTTKDICSLSCLDYYLKQIKFNKHTKVTIKLSLVRDV